MRQNEISASIMGRRWQSLLLALVGILGVATGCAKEKPVTKSPVNPEVRPLTNSPAGNASSAANDAQQKNAAAYADYMKQRAAAPK